MAKATYLGPGDSVEIDGLRIEANKTYDLTNEQIGRLRASDPRAAVEVTDSAPETPIALARIRDSQDRAREAAADEAAKQAEKEADEAARIERESAARTAQAAEARSAASREREAARREAATPRPKRGKES